MPRQPRARHLALHPLLGAGPVHLEERLRVGGDHLGEEGYAALAMVGVVPVNACAEGGAIRPGDLLTSSSWRRFSDRTTSRPHLRFAKMRRRSAVQVMTW